MLIDDPSDNSAAAHQAVAIAGKPDSPAAGHRQARREYERRHEHRDRRRLADQLGYQPAPPDHSVAKADKRHSTRGHVSRSERSCPISGGRHSHAWVRGRMTVVKRQCWFRPPPPPLQFGMQLHCSDVAAKMLRIFEKTLEPILIDVCRDAAAHRGRQSRKFRLGRGRAVGRVAGAGRWSHETASTFESA